MERCNDTRDRRSQRLASLSGILDEIATHEDPKGIARIISTGIADCVHAPFCWVATLDATRRRSSSPSSHANDMLLLESVLTGPADETASNLVSWLPVEGMALSAEEGGDEPDWMDRSACMGAGLSRILIQPLASAGINEGFILLGGIPDVLNAELAADLKLFSTAASLAIQQALSFTELKRSEQDLVRHRTGRLRVLRQWASTIDAMDSMFVITDTEGVIRRLNRSVADRIGQSFQAIIGQPMSRFFGDLPQINQSISGLVPKTAEVTVPFIDGIYELSCFPNLDPEGERIGVIFIFRDVTDEKRIREHLLEAEKLSTLSAVLSGVAHEMNNPLAAVMGFAQLAQELNTEPAVEDCLPTVQVEIEHVTRIVRNLLAFARRSRPVRAPVSLAEILAASMDIVGYEMRVANIQLVTDVPDDLPTILGDEQQLKQAIVAILLFLAHSTRKGAGKGTVQVGASTISSNRVQVVVAAEGVRLSPEEISNVFVLPSTGAEEESADPVGLAMAYGTVTQYGGTLSASGQPDGDFKFFLEFPAITGAQSQTEMNLEDNVLDAVGLRILVADDDEVASRLLSNVLRMAGATVNVVADGQQALDSARTGRFDLLVTDLRMPGMDGDVLIERLREEKNPLATKAMVVTGDILSRETTEFLQISGLPHLTKPFTLAAVRRSIRKVLDEHKVD